MGVQCVELSTLALVMLLSTACHAWPEGTFGLPMPITGCPYTKSFEWETGYRTQKTEPGSHAMDNVHLAGISATEKSPSDRLRSNYCIKTSFPAEGNFEWEKGKYCIYKRDKCPKGFQDGWIYWDDSVPYNPLKPDPVQDFSGTLPSGIYDRNTQIDFCCRKDGYAHHAIRLPRESEFYLLRYSDSCQEVEGMSVTEEWVYWAGEDTVNWDTQSGVYPYRERSTYPQVYTRLFYCYYQPEEGSSRLRTILIITYVIIALVSFLFLICLIACIVQRCVPSLRKGDSERRHNAESAATMLPPSASYQAGNRPTVTMVTAPSYEDVIAADVSTQGGDNGTNAQQQSGAGESTTRSDGTDDSGAQREALLRRPRDDEDRSRDNENRGESSATPPQDDSRPMSLPPSYDEVMARIRPGSAAPV